MLNAAMTGKSLDFPDGFWPLETFTSPLKLAVFAGQVDWK
jgi:hypothetical protein